MGSCPSVETGGQDVQVNGLYGHVARNNFRSIWMFAGFAVAYQLVGLVLLILPTLFLDPGNSILLSPVGYFTKYSFYVLIFSVFAFAYRFMRHMKILEKEMGFTSVSVFQQPRLVRIVETLSITAGINMPKVAVLENDACNAFACGLTPEDATIVVTSGLLRLLSDDELEAVIAHEITHIVNGDIRSMAFANVSISSLMKLSRYRLTFGNGWFSAIFTAIMPIFFLFAAFSNFCMYVAMTVAKMTRLLIASSREYVADAEAVRLTHKPAALISALRKIEGRSAIAGLDPIADAMMIDGAAVGEFATHPTIDERIAALRQHAGSMAHEDEAAFAPATFAEPALQRGPVSQLRTLFGVATKPALAEPAGAAPKQLFERVNLGNEKDMFGRTASGKKKAKIAAYVLVGFMLLSSLVAQRNFATLKSESSNNQQKGAQTRVTSLPETVSPIVPTVRKSDVKKPEAKKFGIDSISTAASEPSGNKVNTSEWKLR